MPYKKSYGPPTRKSERLAASSIESPEPAEPALTPTDTEPEKPVDDIEASESEYDSASDQPYHIREQDTPFDRSSHEEMADLDQNLTGQAPITPAQYRALLDRLAQVEAALQSDEAQSRSARDVTPLNSAFGGTDFKPVGYAARPAFKAYGTDQEAPNPNFDKKARKIGVDPKPFKGEKDTFDTWVIQLADKMVEDNPTYRTERSRMAVLFSLIEGPPNDLLRSRYTSQENPFSGTAEMVATLAAVYHDANQGTKARQELAKLMYDPADKTDIHVFVGKVNTLADRANIPKSERKTLLYEHIPAKLNTQLFDDAQNPDLSYEKFVNKVANAALAHQRAYEEAVKRKQEKKSRVSPEPRRPRERGREPKKESGSKPKETPVLSEKEKKELMDEGRCFFCKKSGHQARRCPEHKVLANMLQTLEPEESHTPATHEGEDSPSSPSSSSSSESENC
jgi:hypothetical protein